MAYFTMSDLFTDNDSVGFYSISDQIFAVGETPYIRKVDPETLKTHESIDLRKYLAINTSSAHPHMDEHGNLYNMVEKKLIFNKF